MTEQMRRGAAPTLADRFAAGFFHAAAVRLAEDRAVAPNRASR